MAAHKITAITGGPYVADANGIVTVDGSRSTSPNSFITTWRWTWGDGTPDTSATVPVSTHQYAVVGTYQIRLVVVDNRGRVSKTARTTATVGSVGPTPPPVTLVSLAVVALGADPVAGFNANYQARATYSDGTVVDRTSLATFFTDNAGVCTWSSPGVLHGVAAGTTTVHATYLTATSPNLSVTVTAAPPPPPPTLQSVTVSGTPPTQVGQVAQLHAQAHYSDGSVLDITTVATWSSDAASIATVSSTGLVTGIAPGAANIRATYGSVASLPVPVSIQPPPVTLVSLALVPTSVLLETGQTQAFVATATYSDGTTSIVTSSAAYQSQSSAVVAWQGGGVLLAVAPGATTVTAKVGTVTSNAVSVTVVAPPPPPPPVVVLQTISISGGMPTVGTSTQLTATGHYSDGTTQDLTTLVIWTSTVPTVAPVSSTGVLTGVSAGTTTIQAVLGTIASAPFIVTVPVPPPPPPPPLTLTCPPPQNVVTSNLAGTAVSYPSAIVSGGVAPYVLTYSKASGTVFVIGVTTVTVSVQDSQGLTRTCSFTVTVTLPPPVAIIPGLQGFGALTRAAYGGAVAPTVYRVTNLNDSGPGSLREALLANVPRVVIFEVSGTIQLAGDINIVAPFLTVAGATAPSPGILIRNRTIFIDTHDVLFQHFRLRTGISYYNTSTVRGSALFAGDPNHGYDNQSYNIVFDHMSLSWGSATNLSGVPTSSNWQISNCIIGEGLSGGALGTFSLGGPNALAYSNALGTVSWRGNLFIGPGDRNPWIGSGNQASIVNNVAYNLYGTADINGWPWGMMQFVGTDPNYAAGILEAAVIGNVFIPGPNTGSGTPFLRIALGADQLPSRIYLSNNSGGGLTAGGDQWATSGVWFCSSPLTCGSGHGGPSANIGNTRILTPDSWYTTFGIVPIVNTGTAIRDSVLAHAGARPTDRDAVDARYVASVLAGTGWSSGPVLSDPAAVGGYPTLAVNVRALTLPANPNVVTGSGYTNLEVWLQTYNVAVGG